jgi:hypothetical protein
MVQIAFEKDKICARQVEEEIRCLAVKVPERISSAPERMLLVLPSAIFLILLLNV